MGAEPIEETMLEAAAIVESTDPIEEADASMESEEEETEVLYVSKVNM